jgi:YegS/Rv2252/BmrU family lipid kinase
MKEPDDLNKYVVIVNPNSGKRRGKKVLERIQNVFIDNNLQADVWLWEYPDQMATLIENAKQKQYKAVIIAGGDGSIHHAATHLFDTHIPLGIIPLGSGNAIANHFKIDKNIENSIKQLKHSQIETIDIGFVNSLPFLGFIGIGIDASVAEQIPKLKNRSFLRYCWLTFQAFRKAKNINFSLKYNDTVNKIESPILSIFNISQFGYKAIVMPNADASDGILNGAWIEKKSMFHFPMLALSLFSGSIHRLQYYHAFSFTELLINRDKEGIVQIDGEIVNLPSSLFIQIKPKALRLLVPLN